MSPRRAARVDTNQGVIVDALVSTGWSVLSLAALGGGVHDLLIGRPGIAVLVEVKNGDNIPSKRKLTPEQVEFHATWKGPQDMCTSVAEALRLGKYWHDRAMGIHSRDMRSRSAEQAVSRGT